MRVLVCGGRNYWKYEVVKESLDPLKAEGLVVIHGGAPGADSLAHDWATVNWAFGVKERIFRADWGRLGKKAGPIRNQEMLDKGKPDLVIAFPGGRGTADMVRRARAAGIEVIEPTK